MEEKYIYKIQLYNDTYYNKYSINVTKFDLKLTNKNYVCDGHRLDKNKFNQIINEHGYFNDSVTGIHNYVIYCYKKDIRANLRLLKEFQLAEYKKRQDIISNCINSLLKCDVDSKDIEGTLIDRTQETLEKNKESLRIIMEKGEVKF